MLRGARRLGRRTFQDVALIGEESLETIEDNWQSAVAVQTFIVLTAQVLSLFQFNKVHNWCNILLR